MGQKVNPVGFRLGVNRGWDSVWYAKKKDFGNYLIEDFKIRDYVKKNVINSGVSKVMIERTSNKCYVTIYTSRPGFVWVENQISREPPDDEELHEWNTERKKVLQRKSLRRSLSLFKSRGLRPSSANRIGAEPRSMATDHVLARVGIVSMREVRMQSVGDALPLRKRTTLQRRATMAAALPRGLPPRSCATTSAGTAAFASPEAEINVAANSSAATLTRIRSRGSYSKPPAGHPPK